MLGTIVNIIAVLCGGTIGLLLGRRIPQKIMDTVMIGLGLCTVYIGISGALEGQNTLIIILSIVFGAIIGEAVDIDHWVNHFASWLEDTLTRKQLTSDTGTSSAKPSLAEGFVTSSLVFCVGAMTILGALQSGLTGDHTTLYTKSLLDLMSSMIFAASLGSGVLLSIAFILVYQGGITLLAQALAPVLSTVVIAEMTCVGSLLIIGLGLNLLKISKFKIMNFLPAIFLPMLLCPLWDWLASLFPALL